MSTERDELAEVIRYGRGEEASVRPSEQDATVADTIIAAGYRKPERVTEFGTIFNRAAVFLNPPAESLEEFKERYESESGWMLTERDPILTRTFLRCDPATSEPTLHAEVSL